MCVQMEYSLHRQVQSAFCISRLSLQKRIQCCLICSNLKTVHCSNYPRSSDVKCACTVLRILWKPQVGLWYYGFHVAAAVIVCAKTLQFVEIYAIEHQILNTAHAFDTRREHNNVCCMWTWVNGASQGLIRDLKVYLIERKLFSRFSLRARIGATANIHFNCQNHFARVSHSLGFSWQLLCAPITTHIIWLAKYRSRLCAKFAVEYICGFQLIARLAGLKYESDTRETIYRWIVETTQWKSLN